MLAVSHKTLDIILVIQAAIETDMPFFGNNHTVALADTTAQAVESIYPLIFWIAVWIEGGNRFCFGDSCGFGE